MKMYLAAKGEGWRKSAWRAAEEMAASGSVIIWPAEERAVEAQ
jgi:hypothetical protein